ncbi:MAG: hypothetical protein EOR50_13240 [Mesorhizobium sp.]|nr:MAG: hypothetical protein EOR50_13240 [Mesorhizobium sp.]
MACRPGLFLPVRVLSRLFRRLFLTALTEAFAHGELRFSNELSQLNEDEAFTRHLARARRVEWVVYSKPTVRRPGPGARLSRPLHPSCCHRQQPHRRGR